MPSIPESRRLRALHELQVLDSASEPLFEALTATASAICGTPIALISLVDAERQWFKANVGLEGVAETPRDVAFCHHAIRGLEPMVVPDATQDDRFARNPLVQGDPNIRFYAGVPLRLSTGEAVGTLCVIDRKPRQLDEAQIGMLEHLATAATAALEQRHLAMSQQQTQERLTNILDGTGAGTWEWNVQTGETRFNERWAEIIGYTLEELGPTTIDTWMAQGHPDDVAASGERLAAHFRGETDSYAYEARMRHREGHWVWVLDQGRVMSRTPEGEPEWMFGTHLDITARRQQEDALARSEWLLNRTGALADVGGWVLELSEGALRWTAQTCHIHGVPENYAPTLERAIAFYAPEARPIVEAAVQTAMDGGPGWDLELPFIRATGERIWVRAVGEVEFDGDAPVRLLGAFQDITRRIHQRQAMERLSERMALANTSAGIGVWDFDPAAGSIVWDAQMYRLYGLEAGDGRAPYDLWSTCVHPEDLGEAEERLAEAMAGGRPFETEFRIVWPGGEVRYLRASARVFRDEGGNALRVVGVNWDSTEENRMQRRLLQERERLSRLSQQLSEQSERMRITLESIGDAVITTDGRGVVQWMNPVAARLTGWPSSEAVGRPLQHVFYILDEVSRLVAPNPVEACFESDGVAGHVQQTVLVSRSGREYGIEESVAPIRSAEGDILGAVLVFHDVTEQRRVSTEMTHRATHDALTGLVNRAEFEARLARALEGARMQGKQYAVMFIDLDQFKIVNDTCGHSVGDDLLIKVSKELGLGVRNGDTLARLGGDEFAVILDGCSLDNAQRVAQGLCDRMHAFRFVHEDRAFRIGTSIGLVAVDNRFVDHAAVIQAADASCYAAKEAGRNCVHVWLDTAAAVEERLGETQWGTRLEQALDEDRFVLHAQRVWSADGEDTAVRAEVLVRLIEPGGKLILPGAFLPAAERFGLAPRIDEWVLKATLAALEPSDVAEVAALSMNLSNRSVGDRAFHRKAIELLDAAGPETCRRLCLEITETAALSNLSDAVVFVTAVRKLGVRIAIDDFGAGPSSYVKQLPVDLIKIDGQFVSRLLDDTLDEATVRGFVHVARVIGARTAAKCVDRPGLLERLGELGVHDGQGYHLHRPEPLAVVLQPYSPVQISA